MDEETSKRVDELEQLAEQLKEDLREAVARINDLESEVSSLRAQLGS